MSESQEISMDILNITKARHSVRQYNEKNRLYCDCWKKDAGLVS